MKVVMRAWWAFGWVGGGWEGESWDGSGKVWSPRSHGEAAGVHLFCLHAAKESGRAVDLFAGTEGDTARSLQQGSLVFAFAVHPHCQPQPEVPPYLSADRARQWQAVPPTGPARQPNCAPQVIFNMMAPPFARPFLVGGGLTKVVSPVRAPSTRLECRVQEKFGAPRTGSPRCALHLSQSRPPPALTQTPFPFRSSRMLQNRGVPGHDSLVAPNP